MTKAPPKYIAEINLIHLIYQRDLFPAQNRNFPPYAYLAFNICCRRIDQSQATVLTLYYNQSSKSLTVLFFVHKHYSSKVIHQLFQPKRQHSSTKYNSQRMQRPQISTPKYHESPSYFRYILYNPYFSSGCARKPICPSQ